jgi:ubiquinone/menaquinone biosynthesis C-methylase UbiE
MEAKLMRRIQRSGWDRASSCYERYWGVQVSPSVEGVLAMAALQPGERVLDVACGTGLVTLPAATQVGPLGRVLATDLAPKMVAAVEQRARDAGLANVDVEAVGAESLGRDGEFDVALCSLGLMYVPDPAAALAEMHRALRPGGRVAVSVWGERRNCGWAEIFPIVDARVSSDVCPMFFALGAPGALRSAVQRAGFVDVDERRLDVRLAYAGADEALGAAFDGGPVALAAARFDEATRASADADYLDSISVYADGDGYRLPGEFVIAAGRRP